MIHSCIEVPEISSKVKYHILIHKASEVDTMGHTKIPSSHLISGGCRKEEQKEILSLKFLTRHF